MEKAADDRLVILEKSRWILQLSRVVIENWPFSASGMIYAYLDLVTVKGTCMVIKSFGASLLLAAAIPASADVLVLQNPSNSNSSICSTCGAGGFRAFATFSLGQDSTLQTAKFDADAPDATGNTVTVWTGDRSQMLFSQSFAGQGAGRVSYTVTLPDWSLAAGDYLLSVYNSDFLAWFGDANGGDDYSYLASANYLASGENLTLELDGTSGAAAVPEPAMLGLFGMGAIGLGLSRRRKAA